MVGSVLSGIKISAAASATTLSSNQMAIVTYYATDYENTLPTRSTAETSAVEAYSFSMPPINRFFGPGETIPSSFTTETGSSYRDDDETAYLEANVTYTLLSGVILVNTP